MTMTSTTLTLGKKPRVADQGSPDSAPPAAKKRKVGATLPKAPKATDAERSKKEGHLSKRVLLDLDEYIRSLSSPVIVHMRNKTLKRNIEKCEGRVSDQMRELLEGDAEYGQVADRLVQLLATLKSIKPFVEAIDPSTAAQHGSGVLVSMMRELEQDGVSIHKDAVLNLALLRSCQASTKDLDFEGAMAVFSPASAESATAELPFSFSDISTEEFQSVCQSAVVSEVVRAISRCTKELEG